MGERIRYDCDSCKYEVGQFRPTKFFNVEFGLAAFIPAYNPVYRFGCQVVFTFCKTCLERYVEVIKANFARELDEHIERLPRNRKED